MRRIQAKIYFSDMKDDRNTNDLKRTGTKTENTTFREITKCQSWESPPSTPTRATNLPFNPPPLPQFAK